MIYFQLFSFNDDIKWFRKSNKFRKIPKYDFAIFLNLAKIQNYLSVINWLNYWRGYSLPPEAYFPPGLGFQNPYDPWGAAKASPEKEVNFLKQEAELLEDKLAGIEKKIKEIEGEKK